MITHFDCPAALKDAIKFNFNGLYIPSFNRNLGYKNISKRSFEIIGSAHNAAEIKFKEKQGCSSIFLSPIFKNDKKKKFLDVIKTNLLKIDQSFILWLKRLNRLDLKK